MAGFGDPPVGDHHGKQSECPSLARWQRSQRGGFAVNIILVGFALASTAIAAGDTQVPGTPKDLTELSLEELMEVEVVYAASRFEQKLADAPSAVTVITAEDIQRYGYRTLADILRSTRGFFTTYDRNYSYAGLRGFSRPGDYNSRVLLLIDGHRLNENVYDSAMIDTGFSLDLALVQRIEIVRGPTSSLYGTSAFFAVINVVTKKESDLRGLSIAGTGGSHAAYDGQISYATRFRHGLEMVLSGSYLRCAGPTLYFKEFDHPKTNKGIASSMDDDHARRLFAKLAFADLCLQGVYSTREKGIPTAAFETIFNDPRTRTIDARGYVALSHNHQYTDRTSVRTTLSYDWYDYHGDYSYDYGEEQPSIVINQDTGKGQWWGGEVQMTSRPRERHRIIAGGEYHYNGQQDQRNYDQECYLDDQRSSSFWAAHLQDELSLTKRLTLSAGIRHDHYETFGGTTNPRFALICRPVQQSTIKLLFGTAFRSPNCYELYYHDGEESATQKPNPDLRPETIRTYELVIEHTLGRNSDASASFYQYDIRDLISLETDPEDDLMIFRNADKVEAQGLELEVRGRFVHSSEGRVSYSYQRTKDVQSGRVLSNSPRHMAKLNVHTSPLHGLATAAVEIQYTSDRNTLAGGVAESYVVTNVTLSRSLVNDRSWVSATAYNLFDKRYTDPASAEHLQDVIIQDGRTFRLGLCYTF